jgi:DNA-binding SARP family transcriptional activator/tetratricopeptide (TPR) repeat protein
VRFGILGPLCVRAGGAELPLSSSRERTVLAALLLQPNRVVTVDTLVDAVWGPDPPGTARGQVQTCVSRLRRRLRSVGIPDSALCTDPVGYRIVVTEDDLDSLAFTRRVAAARAALAAGKLDVARTEYRAALGLWRGSALPGVAGRQVELAASALDEQRLAAWEDCLGVELRLGMSAELVGELTDLVRRHPLRERLRAHLMVALFRSGRQADALAAYRDGHRVFADELGLAPGPEVQDLHRRILALDPTLRAPEPPAAAPGAREPVRCLPRDVPDFVGREMEIAQLLAAVPDGPTAGADGPVVQVIDGMAGMGKTALAVHLAHRLSDRYPDGQLFIDLHGHSETAPIDPATALMTLMRQLGVPDARIPDEVDERIALWRTELASRRALVVLDNAASAEQVAPLLPGAGRCLVLVTSRRRLLGLDGVHPMSLEILTPAEAVGVLRAVVGVRVHAEPDAAADVARLCGHLPLAIRIAAARLNHRPKWTVADLSARLRAARPVLRELSLGGRTVEAAFSLSYADLTDEQRRLFRLLGLHPGHDLDLDRHAAAALADLPVDVAGDLLEDLVDVHLVEAPAAGRYRLHDLLRDYARGLAGATEAKVALTALLDHYLHAAAAATRSLQYRHALLDLGLREPPHTLPALPSAEAAGAWFDAEWRNVVAVANVAFDLGRYEYAWKLPRAVWLYLYRRGYNAELVELHERALVAVHKLGDRTAEAIVRNYLASGYQRVGRWDEAIDLLRTGIALRRELGDRTGEPTAVANLASMYGYSGRFQEAVELWWQAIELAVRLGTAAEMPAMPGAMAGLGTGHLRLGRYPEARHLLHLSYAIARQRGDRYEQALALGELGIVHGRLGHDRLAELLLRRAARLKYELGNPHGHAETLSELGAACRRLGRTEEALDHQRNALHIAARAADAITEALALNHFGRTLCEAGATADALEAHRTALRLADRPPQRYQQALAHAGIGAALRDDDPVTARAHLRRALALFTEMATPERDEIAERLAELEQ